MTRVGIVEGNQIIRWALVAAIAGKTEVEVLWAVDTTLHAQQMLAQSGHAVPDVIVVGYDVPDNGISDLPHVIQLSLRAGPPDPKAFMEAIRSEATGERVAHDVRGAAGILTAREQQVMALLAQGKTNRETAETLEISVKTVVSHRGHVLKKLRLRNNSELTRFAVGHGYVGL